MKQEEAEKLLDDYDLLKLKLINCIGGYPITASEVSNALSMKRIRILNAMTQNDVVPQGHHRGNTENPASVSERSINPDKVSR